MELGPWDLALARGLTVQPEDLTQLVLRCRARPVNFVAKHKNRAIGQLFVCQERIEFHFGLVETAAITRVNEEHNGIHGREVVLPDLKLTE